ncbi:MAG: PEP/pyruvate-binding domain-containing protein [Alphaproteobacteria bacterium]
MNKFVVNLLDAEAADALRFGPKTANQAILAHGGLPTPGGFCLGADAYNYQLESLGLAESAEKAMSLPFLESRGYVADVRIGLFSEPIQQQIREELVTAYQALVDNFGGRIAVRSSSLMEDTEGSSFAGQFQTFLGIDTEEDFLTALRACWGALWSPRAMRYMDDKNIKATDTAMAVLVQPLVEAEVSGGGLSQTSNGGMSISAAWGFGESLAQGEVVPDRYDLSSEGEIVEVINGQEFEHSIHCHTHHGGISENNKKNKDKPSNEESLSQRQCLTMSQVNEIAAYMKKAEKIIGQAVEVEWAADVSGIKMLQARPLHVREVHIPDDIWNGKPSLRGHPGGIGWASGRACIVSCECEISRINPGDVLITKVAGPALVSVLPRVSGVIAELGGSTSHLASLGRERGIPMVLGIPDATQKISDGVMVAVDGVSGEVRWMPSNIS